MTTETTTKRRMMAELIFQNMDDANAAIHSLTELGFKTLMLDWIDPGGTLTTWVLAFLDDYDGDDSDFLSWTGGLADDYGGDVIEAGYFGSDADVEAWIAKKSQ